VQVRLRAEPVAAAQLVALSVSPAKPVAPERRGARVTPEAPEELRDRLADRRAVAVRPVLRVPLVIVDLPVPRAVAVRPVPRARRVQAAQLEQVEDQLAFLASPARDSVPCVKVSPAAPTR